MRFEFEDLQLDQKRYTLSGPAGRIHVEPQVFEVLQYLIVNHERVVPKEELLDKIWGSRFVSESALTSRIKAARRAVGDDGQAQRVIKNVHGRGYQFVAKVRAVGAGRARGALPRLRNVPIGREADITSVIERLWGAPLVTLTGPGGIGKTTVALAVAHRLQDEYADGAVFADLSPVPAGAEITRAAAEAAGLEGGAAETLVGVADNLAHRPVLLVLDNCEHVLRNAAELVDRMLERGDTAHILATSREPLGVPGEHVWPLGPLTDDGPALFVERARAAEPRIDWDVAQPAVVELCRRLDSVPLALELAAGQLRRFDLDELNRRLADQLTLLSSRAPGDGQRHATMETAIDWSYRLLDGAEQALLRNLGVFPSAFDVPAVEACVPDDRAGAVAVLGQLVDKSLVVREPGSGRYRLLETIRMFARDRLDEAGETAPALERHRRSVRDQFASASRLDRWMSASAAAGFLAAHEDARQAFRLSLDSGDAHDAVEIALAASFLWRNARGGAEGHVWVDELLSSELATGDEVWVQHRLADTSHGRGDGRQMFAAAAAANELLQHVLDPAAAGVAAFYAAIEHLLDAERGPARLGAALSVAREVDDPRPAALVQAYLSVSDLIDGRRDDARSALARLDRTSSADGYDRFSVNWAGWMLGLAAQDGAEARRWMDRQQDFLDRTGIFETWLSSFSTAMCDVIDDGDVRMALGRTLALADREGYQADADCVLVLAYAELCAGRFDAAAELVGAARHGRFSATAHYAIYRAALDPGLHQHLDRLAMIRAKARGRLRKPAAILADYGVERAARAPS